MSIVDSLSDFFENDKTGAKALAKRRKERNDNFKMKLKTELFMTDEEANKVIKLIKRYDKKSDDLMSRFDVNNKEYIQTERMGAQMEGFEKEMKEKVIALINEIMREKVREAKEYFEKNPDKRKKN
jgi:hypothetical protein